MDERGRSMASRDNQPDVWPGAFELQPGQVHSTGLPEPPVVLALAEDRRLSDRPQLIELTSKKWKVVQLVGVLMTIGPIMVMCAIFAFFISDTANGGKHPVAEVFAMLSLLTGLIVGPTTFIAGRLGAWWNHG
jgi:hypothetical protein